MAYGETRDKLLKAIAECEQPITARNLVELSCVFPSVGVGGMGVVHLRKLAQCGLVRVTNNRFPMMWEITDAGRKALAS